MKAICVIAWRRRWGGRAVEEPAHGGIRLPAQTHDGAAAAAGAALRHELAAVDVVGRQIAGDVDLVGREAVSQRVGVAPDAASAGSDAEPLETHERGDAVGGSHRSRDPRDPRIPLDVRRRHVRDTREIASQPLRCRADVGLDAGDPRLLVEGRRRRACETDRREGDDEPHHQRDHQLDEREASASDESAPLHGVGFPRRAVVTLTKW